MIDYSAKAQKLFDKHGHCYDVALQHEQRKQQVIKERGRGALENFRRREASKSIALYERSLITAEKLDLPEEDFYDLYFAEDSFKSNNIISGMCAESVIRIINQKGYFMDVKTLTKEKCSLELGVDGMESTYTLTMDQALQFPWVQEQMEDPESRWQFNAKEALLNEAVKLVAKAQFVGVFSPISLVAKELGDTLSHEDLAKKILREGVYNLEDGAFDALEFLKAAATMYKAVQNKPRELEALEKEIAAKFQSVRKQCTTILQRGLDICDKLHLPKEKFYGISAKSEITDVFSLSNLKQKWFIEILRHMGHTVMIEQMNRNVCQVRLLVDGCPIARSLTFKEIAARPDVMAHMQNKDHFVARRTELKLFYELMKSVIKEFYGEQFHLSGSKRKQSSTKKFSFNDIIFGEDDDKKDDEEEDIEAKATKSVVSHAMKYMYDDDDASDLEPPVLGNKQPKFSEEQRKERNKAFIDAKRSQLKKLFAED